MSKDFEANISTKKIINKQQKYMECATYMYRQLLIAQSEKYKRAHYHEKQSNLMIFAFFFYFKYIV